MQPTRAELTEALRKLEARLTRCAYAYYVTGKASALQEAFAGWKTDIEPARELLSLSIPYYLYNASCNALTIRFPSSGKSLLLQGDEASTLYDRLDSATEAQRTSLLSAYEESAQ